MDAQCPSLRFLQGAVELDDEGAELLASACKILRGPGGAAITPEQCRFLNLDFLTSFAMVRWCNNFELLSGSIRSLLDQRITRCG
jgi:hypothetical protein